MLKINILLILLFICDSSYSIVKQYPIIGSTNLYIASHEGPRNTAGSTYHQGLDINDSGTNGDQGLPILAIENGSVVHITASAGLVWSLNESYQMYNRNYKWEYSHILFSQSFYSSSATQGKYFATNNVYAFLLIDRSNQVSFGMNKTPADPVLNTQIIANIHSRKINGKSIEGYILATDSGNVMLIYIGYDITNQVFYPIIGYSQTSYGALGLLMSDYLKVLLGRDTNDKIRMVITNKLSQSDPIAVVGNTGVAIDAYHLHLGLWENGDSTSYINSLNGGNVDPVLGLIDTDYSPTDKVHQPLLAKTLNDNTNVIGLEIPCMDAGNTIRGEIQELRLYYWNPDTQVVTTGVINDRQADLSTVEFYLYPDTNVDYTRPLDSNCLMPVYGSTNGKYVGFSFHPWGSRVPNSYNPYDTESKMAIDLVRNYDGSVAGNPVYIHKRVNFGNTTNDHTNGVYVYRDLGDQFQNRPMFLYNWITTNRPNDSNKQVAVVRDSF